MKVKTSVTLDEGLLRAIDKAGAALNDEMDDVLAHESSIHCDALVSLYKTQLTDYVASLKAPGVRALDHALRIALGLA